MNLIEKLEKYRKEHNLTISIFAQMLGVSLATYYQWVSDEDSKSLNFISKIIEILGDDIYDR